MSNDDNTPAPLALSIPEQRANAIAKYNGVIPNECRFYCESCGWDGTLQFTPKELEDLAFDVEAYTGPCPGKPATSATPKVECGFHMLLPYRLLQKGHESLMDSTERLERERIERGTDIAFDRLAKKVVPMMAQRHAPDARASTVAEHAPAAPAQLPAASRSAQLLLIQDNARLAGDGISSDDIATYKNLVIDVAAALGTALTAAEVHQIATSIMEPA